MNKHKKSKKEGLSMTKLDMVRLLAKKYQLPQIMVSRLINDIFNDIIPSALEKEGRVTLVGFGRWDVCNLAARAGRNPRTGEQIHIPAHKTVRFHAGRRLIKSATMPKK